MRSGSSGQPHRDPARRRRWMARTATWRRIHIACCWRSLRHKGIAALPEMLDAARLSQTRVTKDLRVQARGAIEGFLQAVLDIRCERTDLHVQRGYAVAGRAGAGVSSAVHLEAGERGGSGARVQLCLHASVAASLSPNRALGPLVRRFLDQGHDTGRMLEDGLRLLFRVFRDGLSCSELSIAPLGGALFGRALRRCWIGWHGVSARWHCCSIVCCGPRQRAGHGSGCITARWMSRTLAASMKRCWNWSPASRQRRWRGCVARSWRWWCRTEWLRGIAMPTRGWCGTRVMGGGHSGRPVLSARRLWPKGDAVPTTRRIAFVRFLVRETLAPQIARRSPDEDPNPAAILALKVLDPATGSGHFLVEACRYLGEALYAACRMCDELARRRKTPRSRHAAARATLRQRVRELPDPDELLLCLSAKPGERGWRERCIAVTRAWRYAADWSRCIACMAWTAIRWPSSWRSCRCGWSLMPRDCR